MSDSNDPYNTPPAPERFEPRPDPVEPAHLPVGSDVPAHSEAIAEPIRLEPAPFSTTAGPMPATDPFSGGDDRPTYGDRSVHMDASQLPLEPLPALAGDFDRRRSGDDSGSLSARLVDEFVAWLKTLASAAVYATLIVTFGFQVARVEGQSMSPTLEDQDRLIVNKFVYLTHIGEPQLGDIVMLYYPNNPKKSFVKRVIAAEGQTIRMVDGKVFVNEAPVDDSFVPPEYRGHDDYGPVVIPEGYYFVMGDHRTNSSDSRHWGYVPKKYIIGRVQLRWWPVPEARTF
ncbi:MAG: signal peptidase I [Acidobacteriota bacterium]|nr:signal peptidase I [Acidobacteriota bacterium]MDQ3420062.1 signal peptidase I [Acidobacteriota bacterium]